MLHATFHLHMPGSVLLSKHEQPPSVLTRCLSFDHTSEICLSALGRATDALHSRQRWIFLQPFARSGISRAQREFDALVGDSCYFLRHSKISSVFYDRLDVVDS